MTSSNEVTAKAVQANSVSSGSLVANANYYVGDPIYQPQPNWIWTPQPQYQWYPGGIVRTTGTITLDPRHGHSSSDPTVVNHCPFCGSGALTGRSDGAIDCGVCNETFRVSREPLYSNEPSPEDGAGIETTENDPLSAEDPFEAPAGTEDPTSSSGEEAPDPAAEDGGAEDEESTLPDFMSRLRNKDGIPLGVDDFLLHHAIRSSRGE